MKSFYSKTFAKYSPVFPILMLILLIYGYFLRAEIIPSAIISQSQIDLFGRFGFSRNFILQNSSFFYNLEFWVSMLSIIFAFFLGMSLIGKTAGLVLATFLTLYPYYIANVYSPETITVFCFIVFLAFQLQATISYSRLFSALAGGFFMLSLICNPACLLLGIIAYIYQAINSRNIGVLYNFLLFIGGAFVVYIIYVLFLAFFPNNASFMPSIFTTFSEFGKNFNAFISSPISYIQNTILPLFTKTLAHPIRYGGNLNNYTYWHYLAVFSSIFGFLYSFIEEKARILTTLSLIVLVQAFFMHISFGFLFLFVIIMGAYLIDKIFKDVFC
ncbi:MAG: hypothetical protein E7314_01885 [Clostridiales bacterium]|nr:hypothetical protein [Clostridiales bacterium]